MKWRRLPPLNWILLAAMLSLLALAAGDPPVTGASPRPAALDGVHLRLEGYITALAGPVWTITGQGAAVSVITGANTTVVPLPPDTDAGLYDWVIVTATVDGAGNLHADVVTVVRAAGGSGPTVQVNGKLVKKSVPEWVVGDVSFIVTKDTVISAVLSDQGPPLGSLVSATLERRYDAASKSCVYYALVIEGLADTPQDVPAEFSGIVNDMNSGDHHLVVDTTRVNYNASTVFDNGQPVVGDRVGVQARSLGSGSLFAVRVTVVHGPAPVALGGLVQSIANRPDGSQDWSVLIFPAGAGADPAPIMLHVERSTVVDQSRSTADSGRWIDVLAVPTGPGEYQADSVRPSRPVPVSFSGSVKPGLARQGLGRWLDVSGRRAWLAEAAVASMSLQVEDLPKLEGGVDVDGLMLGNGVVLVQRLQARPGSAQVQTAPAGARGEQAPRLP